MKTKHGKKNLDFFVAKKSILKKKEKQKVYGGATATEYIILLK